MTDKYKAVWVSHSSISDFLTCPRLYYFRNIYKDPITGHKITRMEPPLALGGAVHNIVEALSVLPVENRLTISLLKKFDVEWEKIAGKKGGFISKEQENEYKERGRNMLRRIEENPGPILNKAIKISQDLPHYWLSEEEGIMLCGKIDWLEYLPESDSVHIIDFKTGKNEEDGDSLQLPIYLLLVVNTQNRKVARASYWYLQKENAPHEVPLPELGDSKTRVMEIAKRMKLARQLDHFKCTQNGCRYCIPLEEISKGKGELVGTSSYGQDIYII